jgi:hypothetical protein
MTLQADILSRFSGASKERHPLYLPDLAGWYKAHRDRGTLPAPWAGYSLPEIARAMGVPIWQVVRPWRVETPGVREETTVRDGERIVRDGERIARDGERIARWETPSGTLTARWTIGPDGDWWQTEHLVKSEADLPAAVELARVRSYVLDPSLLAPYQEEVGDDGVVALEIPRRPYSDLLHDYLGWGEGLLLLGEPAVAEILAALEEALQGLVEQVVRLQSQTGRPGIVYSPDNLDGQYISPAAFERHLAASYRRSAETVHGQGRYLLVHAGGPVRHLLAPLAGVGVDGVEGVAGPPQSDATLAEARALVGPAFTLWGGIPQDFLLGTYDGEAFVTAVRHAAQEVSGDPRAILGVADRVPVDADVDRIVGATIGN